MRRIYGLGGGLQPVLRALFPPQCMTCDRRVAEEFGLCGDCWRETPFIVGLACDGCGAPLPGEDEGVLCDDCLAGGHPWAQGRAALLYAGKGRDIVLALKHGDRMDQARAGGQWMARAAAPMVRPGMVVAPVPLHWRRLFRRRYNQSALLGGVLARIAGLEHCPDLLVRRRFTGTQDGRDRDGRRENVRDAMAVHPRRANRVTGRPVLLVDDVMTSGATLAACTEALLAAGATSVSVVVLARVAKEA